MHFNPLKERCKMVNNGDLRKRGIKAIEEEMEKNGIVTLG